MAVVVHYRDADDTLACLQSLRQHAPDVPIVVVDNASPDGSGAVLAERLRAAAGVTLLCSPTNGGFGAGCNQGIAHALAVAPELFAVLLLNPDARVQPGAVAAMLDLAQRQPQAGIVGCRIRHADSDGDWFANGRFPRYSLSRFHCRAPAGHDEFRTEFISGCAMLLRADLLRQGLRFFEPYFLYGEDADLCCLVQRRQRQLWITHRAVVTHRGGGSQGGEEVLPRTTATQLYWQTRAKVMLAARQLTALQRGVFLFVATVWKPVAGLLLLRRVAFLRPYFAGLLAGLRQYTDRPSVDAAP